MNRCGETNELETAGEPDTITWTEPDTYFKRELRTPTVNCLGN